MASSSLELLQERHDIPNGIEHMTANHDISREVMGGILPGRRYVRNIGYSLFSCILAQVVQHRDAWLNGNHPLCLWRKGQSKTSCPCADIEDTCLWSHH